MSARRNTPDRDRVRSTTFLAELAVLLSAVLGILSFTSINQRLIGAIAIPAALLLVAFYLVIRRLYSVTTVNTTIAIAGPSGVGKTVYINVLCSQLLDGASSSLSFVPETQTIQHIYQAVGNLRLGRWPKQTTTDHIDRYRGTIGLTRLPITQIVLNGRLEFQVEFGDAAGENWKELAEEADSRVRLPSRDNTSSIPLIESTFFTYVGESDCLLYFFDAADFMRSSQRVVESVDDLLSTLQLLRAVDGGGPNVPLQRPLAIIISKIDTLTENELRILTEMIDDLTANEAKVTELPAPTNIDHNDHFAISTIAFRRLVSVLARQSRSHNVFFVSALAEATSGRPGSVVDGASLQNWAEFRTEASLEWMFRELWRLRRFRAVAR